VLVPGVRLAVAAVALIEPRTAWDLLAEARTLPEGNLVRLLFERHFGSGHPGSAGQCADPGCARLLAGKQAGDEDGRQVHDQAAQGEPAA
jgi:hypothetical protein